jgi:hypothetical protein
MARHLVELISSVRDEYGLAPALRALDLPRATWYYHEKQKIPYEEKYAHIRPILEAEWHVINRRQAEYPDIHILFFPGNPPELTYDIS